MVNIEKISTGIYGVNCYIVTCGKTRKTAIVDPGGDADDILNYIDAHDLVPEFIALTHGHGDHIGAVLEIKQNKQIPVYIHRDDADMLNNSDKNLTNIMSGEKVEIQADKLMEDGDILNLGDLSFHIIHTPGHTPGSACIKVEDVLLTGDTLFANSIGRTDFEGGSFEQIIDSIKRKLLILDDHVKVFPGHGPGTTIGVERLMNPFINR